MHQRILASLLVLAICNCSLAQGKLTAPQSQPTTQPTPRRGGFTTFGDDAPVGQAGSISGRVIFADSRKPAAGFFIGAWYYEQEKTINLRMVTNTEGEYRIEGLLPGHYVVRVNPGSAERMNWLNAAEDVRVAAGQDFHAPDIILNRGATVSGVILDQVSGAPSRAMVRAFAQGDDPTSATMSPDRNGAYNLRLRPGKYFVGIVNPERYVGEEGTLGRWMALEEGKRYSLDFNLTPKPGEAADPAARPVSGKVVDVDGHPLAHVLVSLDAIPGKSTSSARMVVDGNFSFAPVLGKHVLRAFSGDLPLSTPEPVEIAPSEDVTLHLLPRPSVKGVVRNKEGKPIVAARVTVAMEIAPRIYNVTTVGPTPITDFDGKYEAPVLYAGQRFHLIISYPAGGREYAQHASEPFEGLMPGEQIEAPDMILQRADSFLTGRLTDEQGKPIQHGRVSIRGSDVKQHSVAADPDGYFHMLYIPEGQYELTASAPKYESASRQVKAGTSDQVVILKLLPQLHDRAGGP